MSKSFARFNLTILIIVSKLMNKTLGLDVHNYDEYGCKITSNNYFAAFAQNEIHRFVVSMVPFGENHFCAYNYQSSKDYVVSIATGRQQNSSQLFFVYLMTNNSDVIYQRLGLVRFSLTNLTSTDSSSIVNTCDQNPMFENRIRPVRVWNEERSSTGTLEVEPKGKYAYGFLSKTIFIFDIDNDRVNDFPSTRLFSSTVFEPNAMAIGTVDDQYSMAILVGFSQVDRERMLPLVYLVRLDPPNDIFLVDNYTLNTGDTNYVRRRDTTIYKYDYVLSVSIDDRTNQVLIGIPYINQTYLFSFNQTRLIFEKLFRRPARSISWLADEGQQAALLLADLATLPWSQSRIEILNISSSEIIYTLPNNQQTLEQWSSQPLKLIRMSRTNSNELVVLSEDGTIILVSSTEPGFYSQLNFIVNPRKESRPCPSGTYKSFPGIGPCTICPRGRKSSQPFQQNSFNETILSGIRSNMTMCVPCLNTSFCPPGSIKDLNKTELESISQAYSYPSSEGSASFDDILMENTFSLQSDPIRCLLISPLFWSLIVLSIAGFILIVMAFLYYSNERNKYFHRLKCVFRHSDLIGNGELWFGGLVSLSMIVLIIYTFVFGSIFLRKYPIERSTDADFACDPSLRNSQFSSSMHLLSNIKSDDEKLIFQMLDEQLLTVKVQFLQTGYRCQDLGLKQVFDAYSIDLPVEKCTMNSETATTTLVQTFPDHKLTFQVILSGPHFVGGLRICLNGAELTDERSHFRVNQLNYCQSFYSFDQTISQTIDVQFALTRVVNRTEYLDYSGSSNYSAIWIPTASHGSLSDRLAYEQRGVYLRYLSTRNLLTIAFSETDFYVFNQEKPIARNGEILFHNILFTTTIIGIFALAFVLVKLTLLPLVKWSINRQLFCWKTFNKYRETSKKKQNEFVVRRF